ncbi:MAG: hypothetical protein HFI17_17940 [Lachnospiraceae bacterium]|nr:hypothetical protein [Lachnospiraceae bacterium]
MKSYDPKTNDGAGCSMSMIRKGTVSAVVHTTVMTRLCRSCEWTAPGMRPHTGTPFHLDCRGSYMERKISISVED